MAVSLLNLSSVYSSQGRFAEAETVARRALAIDRQSLPPGHQDIAKILINLGGLAEAQGQQAEAQEFDRQALAVAEQAFGREHPLVALCLSNLAGTMSEPAKSEEAVALLNRAENIYRRHFGDHHPTVFGIETRMATVAYEKGDYVKAATIDQGVLTARERALGALHPDVGTSLRNLAVDKRALKQFAEAEELLSRAIRIEESTGGRPKDVSRLYDLRARTRDQLGRRDEAIQDLQRAMDQAEFQRARRGR